jgi:hypothetical protein
METVGCDFENRGLGAKRLTYLFALRRKEAKAQRAFLDGDKRRTERETLKGDVIGRHGGSGENYLIAGGNRRL